MPEKKAKGKAIFDRDRCKGCQLCIEVCPNELIEVDTNLNKQGYSPARAKEKQGEKGCTGCAQCAMVCPEVAIEVYRAK